MQNPSAASSVSTAVGPVFSPRSSGGWSPRRREAPWDDLAELLDRFGARVEPEVPVPFHPAAPGEEPRLGVALDRRDGLAEGLEVPPVQGGVGVSCHGSLLCVLTDGGHGTGGSSADRQREASARVARCARPRARVAAATRAPPRAARRAIVRARPPGSPRGVAPGTLRAQARASRRARCPSPRSGSRRRLAWRRRSTRVGIGTPGSAPIQRVRPSGVGCALTRPSHHSG